MATAKSPWKNERTPSKLDRTPMSAPTTAGNSGRAKEEKIFVTVRVRPLSKKEQAVKDVVAWECTSNQTIAFKGPQLERTSSPTSYTFDRVFGPTCQTETVYAQGAKDVALSALNGINATIFAYGQTSSGKTYTMRGITESAVNDIYKHIEANAERDFVIKISGMEIYNEVVRDLLRPDSGQLRLLDDPEKGGTIVEKLEEESVQGIQHLKRLIGICEAQRQVGETALNDASSRSHLIIRLVIESTLRENSGCVKSFVATLNFVDLAGSERAAQTQATGERAKEGAHINRSLLTLTTVIRKLSMDKRGGHIPYRDSKLTRILQLSLGGNARTAIICTMSPALTHVEQSRNTLFFATCAKEVTNAAQVNVVASDKQLVVALRTEIARLEAELNTPDRRSASDILLIEKEKQIKQMEEQMAKVIRERDLALLKLGELQQKLGNDESAWNPFSSPISPQKKVAKCLTFSGPSQQHGDKTVRKSSTAQFMLVHEIRKLEQMQQQLGEEAKQALDVLQKEVACHRLGNQDGAETIAKLLAEIQEMRAIRLPVAANADLMELNGCATEAVSNQEAGACLKEELSRLHLQGDTIAHLETQLENLQRSLDKLVTSLPTMAAADTAVTPNPRLKKKKKRMLPLALNSNIINKPGGLLRTPCSPLSSAKSAAAAPDSDAENQAPPESDTISVESSEKGTPAKSEDAAGDVSSRDGTGTPRYRRSSSVSVKKMHRMFQTAAEENFRSIQAYVTELKERVTKLQYQKQLLFCQVLEMEANEATSQTEEVGEKALPEQHHSPGAWRRVFREQMQMIIHLWDVCHVSIVHRTQFYLLFRGDPADQIYIEVELRRLTWLQQHFAEGGAASPATGDDSGVVSFAESVKILMEEREQLARRMSSRLTEEEREQLFMRWGVPVEGKQRKLQLVNKLWTDPDDAAHIEQSAAVVARLVGFCEGGGNISKEMFELNFSLPASRRPWFQAWQPISNLLQRL